VFADDGVGARCVDDMNLPQHVNRCLHDLDAALAALTGERVAVFEDVNPRGGRRHPFLQRRLADQRVDKGALAGVELADNYEEEQLVELAD
jgi:hypothetical protein